MDKVNVSSSTRTTMVVNFDLPEELRRILSEYTEYQREGSLPDEILVTIAGVRVGKLNMHSRNWDAVSRY